MHLFHFIFFVFFYSIFFKYIYYVFKFFVQVFQQNDAKNLLYAIWILVGDFF